MNVCACACLCYVGDGGSAAQGMKYDCQSSKSM